MNLFDTSLMIIIHIFLRKSLSLPPDVLLGEQVPQLFKLGIALGLINDGLDVLKHLC